MNPFLSSFVLRFYLYGKVSVTSLHQMSVLSFASAITVIGSVFAFIFTFSRSLEGNFYYFTSSDSALCFSSFLPCSKFLSFYIFIAVVLVTTKVLIVISCTPTYFMWYNCLHCTFTLSLSTTYLLWDWFLFQPTQH